MTATECFIRYIYRGQTLRNGRIIPFCLTGAASATDQAARSSSSPHTTIHPLNAVPAALVLAALRAEPSVDLVRFRPLFYCQRSEGWRPFEACGLLDLTPGNHRRLEVLLEDTSLWAGSMQSTRGRVPEEEGFFGIGIFRGKVEMNHGTLWRTAYQLGASFVFSLGARFEKQSTDTMKVGVHTCAHVVAQGM